MYFSINSCYNISHSFIDYLTILCQSVLVAGCFYFVSFCFCLLLFFGVFVYCIYISGMNLKWYELKLCPFHCGQIPSGQWCGVCERNAHKMCLCLVVLVLSTRSCAALLHNVNQAIQNISLFTSSLRHSSKYKTDAKTTRVIIILFAGNSFINFIHAP